MQYEAADGKTWLNGMDNMKILETRRTIRQYRQKPIPHKDLKKMVNAARLAPSARNIQPLEYVVVDSAGPLKEMFGCMGFGGGIKSFRGREPSAYVIVLINKYLSSKWQAYDCGMAVENMAIAAWGMGIGSCILGRINKERIRQLLSIPDKYDIDLVVALGYPAEKPVAEDMKGQSVDYHRDANGTLHVPKRRMKDILHRNGF